MKIRYDIYLAIIDDVVTQLVHNRTDFVIIKVDLGHIT